MMCLSHPVQDGVSDADKLETGVDISNRVGLVGQPLKGLGQACIDLFKIEAHGSQDETLEDQEGQANDGGQGAELDAATGVSLHLVVIHIYLGCTD